MKGRNRFPGIAMAILLASCGGGGNHEADTSEDDQDVTDTADAPVDTGTDTTGDDPASDAPDEDAAADTATDDLLEEEAPPLGTLGDPCAVPADCEGGFCITNVLFDGFVDGYCTQIMCDPLDPVSCGTDGTCLDLGGSLPTICVRTCDAETDCRDGLSCVGMCIPDAFVSDPTPTAVLDPTDSIISAAVLAMSEDDMRSRIEILSGAAAWASPGGDVTITSRAPQAASHSVAIDYMTSELEALGLVVAQIPFAVDTVSYVNLEARLAGVDPLLDPVVVTAHWDSTASGETTWDPAVDPAPGASDNASGVAILIEVAAVASAIAATDPPDRDIVFALFDGEEDGLLGSVDYVEDLTAAVDTILCVVNTDMVGWNASATPDRFWYVYDAAHESVATFDLEAIQDFVPTAIPIPTSSEMWGNSDHASFWAGGYCATSMSTFPPEQQYHTAGDTVDTYDWPIFMNVAQSTAAIVAARAWRY